MPRARPAFGISRGAGPVPPLRRTLRAPHITVLVCPSRKRPVTEMPCETSITIKFRRSPVSFLGPRADLVPPEEVVWSTPYQGVAPFPRLLCSTMDFSSVLPPKDNAQPISAELLLCLQSPCHSFSPWPGQLGPRPVSAQKPPSLVIPGFSGPPSALLMLATSSPPPASTGSLGLRPPHGAFFLARPSARLRQSSSLLAEAVLEPL